MRISSGRCSRGVKPERFNWIGHAGCVFFRKSFVVRSIWISTIGLQSARASLSPRLAKESATPSLSSQLNRSGLAGTISLDRSCWLRLLPQELRCSLVTDLQWARASLSPRLAKESARPSLSSQLNRSGLAGTISLDRSRWLRPLPQELRCSLDLDLNHWPSIGPRLARRLVLRKNPPRHPFPPN